MTDTITITEDQMVFVLKAYADSQDTIAENYRRARLTGVTAEEADEALRLLKLASMGGCLTGTLGMTTDEAQAFVMDAIDHGDDLRALLSALVEVYERTARKYPEAFAEGAGQ